jgi:hypothetical protein
MSGSLSVSPAIDLLPGSDYATLYHTEREATIVDLSPSRIAANYRYRKYADL